MIARDGPALSHRRVARNGAALSCQRIARHEAGTSHWRIASTGPRYPAPSCRSLATAGCSGASRQPIDPFARLGCQNSPIWRSLGRVGDVGTRWDVPGEAQGRPAVCAVSCASVLEIIRQSFRRGESGSADARDEPGRLRTAHGGVLEEVSPSQPFFAGSLH